MSIHSPENDLTLLRAIARGDVAALATVYDRHVAVVFRVAMAVSGTRQRAEDAVHDVFVRLWRTADSLARQDEVDLRGWLLRQLRRD